MKTSSMFSAVPTSRMWTFRLGILSLLFCGILSPVLTGNNDARAFLFEAAGDIRYPAQATKINEVFSPIHLREIELFSLWMSAPSDMPSASLAKANTAAINQPALPVTILTTIDDGAYIIDMGQTPQTADNALKAYGSIWVE